MAETDTGCSATADCAGEEDGDACNGTLICDGGVCVVDASTMVVCEDSGDPCAVATCDPATGSCTSELDAGASCDDGDPCTDSDTCSADGCLGAAKDCDDGDPCTDDACDTTDGSCATSHNSAPCDDDNACTEGDVCAEGECTSGAPVAECSCESTADCAVYEDGDLCTGTFICSEGGCLIDPATVVTCQPSEAECHADGCDPDTGLCGLVPLDPGTGCDDGNGCTLSDVCDDAGTCAGEELVCPNDDACLPTECDADLGACAASKAPCDDDDDCTHDFCRSDIPELCTHIPVDCDDQNACTADTCSADTGCLHGPLTGPCDVGSACMPAECTEITPSAESCAALGLPAGNRSNAVCAATNADGVACPGEGTWPDAAAYCAGAGMRLCTLDETNAKEATGTGCGYDFEQVWTSTQCLPGRYWSQLGNPPDGNTPTCEPMGQEGVAYIRCCADADPSAPSAACVPTGAQKECSDGLGCTADSCDPGSGECDYQDVVCADTGPCNVDACEEGIGCTAEPLSCDDDDPCTSDACDPDTGECSHTLDEGASCDIGDVCLQGACTLAAPSALSCDELGWTGSGQGSDEVCAKWLDGCNDKVQWQASVDACTLAGARLCTLEEVLAGETTGPSDCSLNRKRIWTSDPCGDGAYYAHMGASFNGPTECVDSSEALRVICCADALPGAPVVHCEPTVEISCEDDDPCTVDGCDPVTGCQFVDVACGDEDECTTDACDVLTGECTHAVEGCSDDDLCTVDACTYDVGACPFGELSAGACFGLFTGNLTWSEARSACQGLGGDLASIASPGQYEAAQDLATAGGCGGTVSGPWVGLTDELLEGNLVWSDGSAMTYAGSNSGAGGLGINGGPKDYVYMTGEGWSYATSDAAQPCYLCEVPIPVADCGHIAVDCDDASGCTSDSCDGATGECFFAPTCADDNPCTSAYCDATDTCTVVDVAPECCGGDQLEPGCAGNAACESCVCGDDSFCCDVSWDGLCAECASGDGGACDECIDVCACGAVVEECDGDLCSTGDTCSSGECVPGVATQCADTGNECTIEVCDPASGSCGLSSGLPDLGATGECCDVVGAEDCADSPCKDCVCSYDDFCCDDWDHWCAECAVGGPGYQGLCDVGGCSEACGCDVPCDYGAPCVPDGLCLNGSCEEGVVNCDDGDDCTLDSCAPDGSGCIHGPPDVVTLCPADVAILAGEFVASDWSLVQAAAIGGNGEYLEVTPDSPFVEGGAWLADKHAVAGGFTATMDIVFTSTQADTGDGMAFVVQGSALDAIGNQDGVGTNDLSIAMDSHANAGEPDSAIEIRVAGAVLAAVEGLFDLTESAFELSVTYDGVDTVTVSIDGVEALTASGIDLAASGVVDADGAAWVGFTARTGQAHEIHAVYGLDLALACENVSCGADTCVAGLCLAAEESALSCEDLAFANGFGSPEVCGESDLPGCNEADFDTARDLCADNDARLCTIDELLADESRGSGCGYDNRRVWSSSRCAGGGYYTAAGSTANAGSWPTECTNAARPDVAVRCCADATLGVQVVSCQGHASESCDDGDDCTVDTCEYGNGCVNTETDACEYPEGTGSCCYAPIVIGNIGCGVHTCQTCVCASDPFCCDVQWGSQCVDLAANDCWLSCNGECLPGDGGPGFPGPD